MSAEYPETVLFVDDDQYLLEAIRRQFQRRFAIAIACGGDEALEIVKTEGPIAVVVSDESMPGMPGGELLRNVQKLCPKTVCILFSGNMNAEAMMSAEDRAGLFEVLSKPSPRQKIMSSVEAAIEEHRSLCSEAGDSMPVDLMYSSSEEGEVGYVSHR